MAELASLQSSNNEASFSIKNELDDLMHTMALPGSNVGENAALSRRENLSSSKRPPRPSRSNTVSPGKTYQREGPKKSLTNPDRPLVHQPEPPEKFFDWKRFLPRINSKSSNNTGGATNSRIARTSSSISITDEYFGKEGSQHTISISGKKSKKSDGDQRGTSRDPPQQSAKDEPEKSRRLTILLPPTPRYAPKGYF